MTTFRTALRSLARPAVVAAVVVVAAAGLTACATRPTEEELTRSILTATAAEAGIDLTEETAACIARELLTSGLSDTTLSGLADDFDAPEVLEAEVNDVELRVTEAAAVCQPRG